MNKKIFLYLTFFLFFTSIISASGQRLSDRAKISLITISPGEELYSSFGHSAIWVFDPVSGMDRVYNYGTFNFSPSFYVNFVMGKLIYTLSIGDIEGLIWGSQLDNRGVTEQVLNLSKDQKDRLFNFLETNYLPQNRDYLYDFFFDNCSSRLRDALVAACGESLDFNLVEKEKQSFRQLLDPYLLDKQWQDLGMDTGLGMPSDRIATPFEYMYLPDHLMAGFASATLRNDSATVPLVSETNILFQNLPPNEEPTLFSPTLIFWVLFFIVLIITWFQLKKKSVSSGIDYGLLSFTGLLGLLLLFLWFITDHKVTVNNWNVIWAMPLNLFVVFVIKRSNWKAFVKNYFLIYSILLLLFVISWNFIPQEINKAVFPFILILLIRSLFNYYRSKIAIN